MFVQDYPTYICYNWMPRIADHILDSSAGFYRNAGVTRQHHCDSFNPEDVRDNDVVFVKTDYIINGVFEKHYLPKIKNKFNLMTAISSYHLGRDDNGRYKNILHNPLVKKWICTNPPAEYDEKIIPIPIGFQEPDRFGGNQMFLGNIKATRSPFEKKENAIFLPYHDLNTNQFRSEQIRYLSNLPFVHIQKEKQNLIQYYQSLNRYKFVIGLEGSGPDIHRNYETMLVGSIPVNIKNVIENLFSYHDATAVFLTDWRELNKNLFDKMLSTCYNIDNNDKFLYINHHSSHIRKKIKMYCD